MSDSKDRFLRIKREQHRATVSDRPSDEIKAEWQAAIERSMNNFRGARALPSLVEETRRTVSNQSVADQP